MSFKLKIYRNPLHHPSVLFIYYVIAHMFPSIFLLFTEPLNAWGKGVLFLLPLGIYLICFSLTKNSGLIQLLLIPLLVIHAFQLVVFYLFGEDVIAVDMFLNLVTTNSMEAGELLASIWVSIIFVCVLYIPVITIAAIQVRNKLYLNLLFRKKAIIAGCVIIAVSFTLAFFSKNINTGKFTFYKEIYPVDVFYNFNFAIKKWKKNKDYPKTSANFTFEAKKDSETAQREIYVLIIGETNRADNWSLYGYERETTPVMKNDTNIFFFDDVITQSNATHKSVSVMLSAAAAENYDDIYNQKSIIDAFKETGFKTVFLSNQGDNHLFTQYFAESADFYRNIRTKNGKKINVKNNYDTSLLPIMEHYMDSIQENLFIILHTYGSHFNYKERYPDEFSVFKPDNATKIEHKQKERLVNAYDNSILFTDHFLGLVRNSLENNASCSAMLYISDHGEDILDDSRMRFLHASPIPTYYQLRIPLLIWFSSEYRSNFPEKVASARNNKEKPVASNAVFHTLLDIAAIQTAYLHPGLSLVSPDFEIKKRVYLDDHDEAIFYYEMNLKKEDRKMIEKSNMHH